MENTLDDCILTRAAIHDQHMPAVEKSAHGVYLDLTTSMKYSGALDRQLHLV